MWKSETTRCSATLSAALTTFIGFILESIFENFYMYINLIKVLAGFFLEKFRAFLDLFNCAGYCIRPKYRPSFKAPANLTRVR